MEDYKMSDFFELCEKRQSCRKYTGEKVAHENLAKIAEAARLTPSGCNAQPWKFIFVESEDKVQVVAKACQSFEGINKYTDTAGAFVVVLEEYAVLNPHVRRVFDSQYFAKNDCGAAVVTICYAAEELGVASGIIGLFDREAIEKELGITHESRIHMVIALGYPDSPDVRKKARKELSEIVKFA